MQLLSNLFRVDLNLKNAEIILYAEVKKKSMKIVNIDRENLHIF